MYVLHAIFLSGVIWPCYCLDFVRSTLLVHITLNLGHVGFVIPSKRLTVGASEMGILDPPTTTLSPI